jgi:hypothetical protein
VRALSVSVSAIALAACLDATPPAGPISCAAADECPDDLRCDVRSRRCVLPGTVLDVDAPRVVRATFTPAFARDGVPVTLDIELDERAGGDPARLVFEADDAPTF